MAELNDSSYKVYPLSGLFTVMLTIFLFSSSLLFSQQKYFIVKQNDTAAVPLKSLPDSFSKKRFCSAGCELMLAEVTPWLIDEYIRDVDYTKISWQTLSHNLNLSNWEWDGDGFRTNQFGHPYHGSFYFNAFRTNGYNFWQSSLATFAGSYLWETVAENQPPAPNDFINTSFGGIVLGEMVFRLSNRIINNRKNGQRRQASEVIALLVNPMNGLNRITNKKWGRSAANAARDTTPVNAEFDIGARKFKANNINNNFVFHGRARFLYGSPYENYKTPFSNILINVEFGYDDSSKVNIVSISGSLNGWHISPLNPKKNILLLTANYDYIHNEAFFYSAQSVRLGLHSMFDVTNKVKINTAIGGGLVLLAGVPDEHEYKGRYYDYCWGAGFNGSFNISIANRFFGNISYRGGWLRTISGNATHYFLHTINGEIRYRVVNGFSICAEPGYFSLRGNYKEYDDVSRTYPYIRVSARYSVLIK